MGEAKMKKERKKVLMKFDTNAFGDTPVHKKTASFFPLFFQLTISHFLAATIFSSLPRPQEIHDGHALSSRPQRRPRRTHARDTNFKAAVAFFVPHPKLTKSLTPLSLSDDRPHQPPAKHRLVHLGHGLLLRHRRRPRAPLERTCPPPPRTLTSSCRRVKKLRHFNVYVSPSVLLSGVFCAYYTEAVVFGRLFRPAARASNPGHCIYHHPRQRSFRALTPLSPWAGWPRKGYLLAVRLLVAALAVRTHSLSLSLSIEGPCVAAGKESSKAWRPLLLTLLLKKAFLKSPKEAGKSLFEL